MKIFSIKSVFLTLLFFFFLQTPRFLFAQQEAQWTVTAAVAPSAVVFPGLSVYLVRLTPMKSLFLWVMAMKRGVQYSTGFTLGEIYFDINKDCP